MTYHEQEVAPLTANQPAVLHPVWRLVMLLIGAAQLAALAERFLRPVLPADFGVWIILAALAALFFAAASLAVRNMSSAGQSLAAIIILTLGILAQIARQSLFQIS